MSKAAFIDGPRSSLIARRSRHIADRTSHITVILREMYPRAILFGTHLAVGVFILISRNSRFIKTLKMT